MDPKRVFKHYADEDKFILNGKIISCLKQDTDVNVCLNCLKVIVDRFKTYYVMCLNCEDYFCSECMTDNKWYWKTDSEKVLICPSCGDNQKEYRK